MSNPGNGVANPDWFGQVSPTAGKPLWQTQTYRRFLYASLLMAGMVGAFGLLGLLEAAVAGSAEKVARPFIRATHCVGLAHFVIGFWFLVTSSKMRNPRSRVQIGIATLIGIGLCWLFAWGGGSQAYPRIPTVALFVYFMFHELRDESLFYQQYKEAPTNWTGRKHIAALLVGIVTGIFALAWSIPSARPTEMRDLSWLAEAQQLEGGSLVLAGLVPSVVLALISVACFVWCKRRFSIPVRRLLSRDRPLWAVYATIPLIVLISGRFGGGSASPVLLHVTAWWVFVSIGLARFGKQGGLRELGISGWIRQTQVGFQTLHIGLALIVLVLSLVWLYRFDGAADNPLVWVAARQSFYYWTIMHVTISMVPKPS